jgi:hypothetical protein
VAAHDGRSGRQHVHIEVSLLWFRVSPSVSVEDFVIGSGRRTDKAVELCQGVHGFAESVGNG